MYIHSYYACISFALGPADCCCETTLQVKPPACYHFIGDADSVGQEDLDDGLADAEWRQVMQDTEDVLVHKVYEICEVLQGVNCEM